MPRFAAFLLLFPSIVYADDLYVPDDFVVIQDAIDAANVGDVVIVRDGVWTGFFNKDLDFDGKAITVRSENGPGNCIIDCEGEGRGFIFQSGETPESIVEGLTIRSGFASPGAGISIENSSPTIRNCIIQNNTAMVPDTNRRAGGAYCHNSQSTFTNCTFVGNHAGSGGGGLFVGADSDVNVRNTVFRENSANAGGGVFLVTGAAMMIKNSLLVSNASNGGQGAGIAIWNIQSLLMTNCSILNNDGIGLRSINSSPSTTIKSCIFWGNSASIINDGSPLFVRYSNVEGGYEAGNIDMDPMFVDEFHIGLDSPCLDAGDPNYISEPGDTDLDGDNRVINGRVDMGADEVPVDTDGDGVLDDDDVCNNTPVDIPVDAAGRPVGDIDLDCDIDLTDFAILQEGFTGPL